MGAVDLDASSAPDVEAHLMLQGPDPEQFRTKVYGARWYCDPLPTCDLAPASQDRWPAVSTVKKAWSKPFRKKLPTGETVPLDAFRAAEFAVDRIDAVKALDGDRAAAVTLIATSAGRFLNKAADRGSGVHTVLEDLGAGKAIEEAWLDADVVPFVAACRSFIADWQPLWIAAEVIVFNRTIGFAGTADAVITIERDGQPWTALVDWKTRGGDHGAYEEEIAQIGGYSLGDYIVALSPNDGRPIRMKLPALDGGLIVSLTKDSYQPFPVDLAEAQAAFRAMHVAWQNNREGQSAARRGRLNPLVAVSTPSTTTPSPLATEERVAWLRTRIEAIQAAGHVDELALTWPTGTPTLKQGGLTDAHVDAIARACDQVETAHRMPFGPTDPVFTAFQQQPDTALERSVTEARQSGPTAQEWAQRARALLAPLEDEAMQHAIAVCAGAVDQKMTRRLHDNIAAIVTEMLFSQDGGPDGAVAPFVGDDGTWTIAVTAGARDRLTAVHGNEIAALAAAKSHAKALGLPAPRSLKSVVEQPLLVALTAAGQ